MQAALPAMSGRGVAFYAAIWPRHLYCAQPENPCNPFAIISETVGKRMFALDKPETEGPVPIRARWR